MKNTEFLLAGLRQTNETLEQMQKHIVTMQKSVDMMLKYIEMTFPEEVKKYNEKRSECCGEEP